MLDLPKFCALLENAQAVEEEAFDVRFEETVSLVEQEKFTEALPLIEKILREGRVDIRLVMYLFYAFFLEEGVKSLIEIFPTIVSLINEHWEKISPVQMRDKHASNALSWFFASLSKKLRRSEKLHKEKRPDEFWNASAQTLSHADIENLILMVHQLIDFFGSRWRDNSFQQHLLFIAKWLKDFSGILSAEEPIVNKKEPEEEAEQEEARETREESGEHSYIASQHDKAEGFEEDSLEGILISSDKMRSFYHKIHIFESLIQKGDFAKAALVADDITHTLENFDPSVFFPKMFARYFALMAEHIDTLSMEWESKKSLKWLSLQKLYQTDIEEFVKW